METFFQKRNTIENISKYNLYSEAYQDIQSYKQTPNSGIIETPHLITINNSFANLN